jgi:hypothetical protein
MELYVGLDVSLMARDNDEPDSLLLAMRSLSTLRKSRRFWNDAMLAVGAVHSIISGCGDWP